MVGKHSENNSAESKFSQRIFFSEKQFTLRQIHMFIGWQAYLYYKPPAPSFVLFLRKF